MSDALNGLQKEVTRLNQITANVAQVGAAARALADAAEALRRAVEKRASGRKR